MYCSLVNIKMKCAYNYCLQNWAIPENIHTIPRTAFTISEGEGGSRLWNSEGMGGILRLEIRRHGGISQVGFLE